MIIVSRLVDETSVVSIDYINMDRNCNIETEKNNVIDQYGIPLEEKETEVKGNVKLKYYNEKYGNHWIMLVRME